MTRAAFDRTTWLVLVGVAAGCTVEYDAARDRATETAEFTEAGSATEADVDAECTDLEALCGDVCARLDADQDHCGDCDVACFAETLCLDGVCRQPCEDGCEAPHESCEGSFCECAPGLTNCAGECIDLETDPDHCGECSEVCEDASCAEGECVESGCPDFGDDCDGACTDLDSDRYHCGDCFRECGLDEVCVQGDCYVYDTLPSEVCGECPCQNVCPEPADHCCFSDVLETDICVYGPACPE